MSSEDTAKPSDVPSLPVDEILLNVAQSMVRAQQALDSASLATAVEIRAAGLDEQLGLQPRWYTIPELLFELRLAFEIGDRGEVTTQLVDAAYQSKYGFSVKASSDLTTKIVATPPPEGRGLSLLDERTVLRSAGRIKRVVEAYDRADAPYFVIRYRAFVTQGYAGGLWYVLLMDRSAEGQAGLRALVVIDDASARVLRLWTDTEPPVEEGAPPPEEGT
jgi:uncharacterized protein involved in exopolysaccharide biosynthesis